MEIIGILTATANLATAVILLLRAAQKPKKGKKRKK